MYGKCNNQSQIIYWTLINLPYSVKSQEDISCDLNSRFMFRYIFGATKPYVLQHSNKILWSAIWLWSGAWELMCKRGYFMGTFSQSSGNWYWCKIMVTLLRYTLIGFQLLHWIRIWMTLRIKTGCQCHKLYWPFDQVCYLTLYYTMVAWQNTSHRLPLDVQNFNKRWKLCWCSAESSCTIAWDIACDWYPHAVNSSWIKVSKHLAVSLLYFFSAWHL